MKCTRNFSVVMSVATGLLMGIGACSSIQVTSDYDPQTNFGALRSYAWLANARQPGDDPRLHNSLVDARVRTAVDDVLATKGYRKTAATSANFLVTYYLGLENKIDVHTIHSSYGYGYRGWYGGYGTETMVDQYDEGSIILDVLDPKGSDLLWRGTGSARVSTSNTPEEREKRINEAVAKILASFPPQ
jgi:hypothetical protein